MKAWILAAGRGSRLDSLTRNKPKCLVELEGRTLLHWQIDALHSGGVDDISIVVGYSNESIQIDKLELVENPRWADTNMVYSLCCAEGHFNNEPFMVSYSDILYPAETVQKIIQCNEDIVIAFDLDWKNLWQTRMEDPLEDAESFRFNSQNHITEIGERAQRIEDIMGQYMGLLKFTEKGWKIVRSILDSLTAKELDSLQMTKLLAKIIATGHQVTGVPIFGHWVEVDSQQDINRYELELAKNGVGSWHHDWRIS
jgi:L-glutamine-phosphate cytidylyltransferase